jgi:hypothetical protein
MHQEHARTKPWSQTLIHRNDRMDTSKALLCIILHSRPCKGPIFDVLCRKLGEIRRSQSTARYWIGPQRRGKQHPATPHPLQQGRGAGGGFQENFSVSNEESTEIAFVKKEAFCSCWHCTMRWVALYQKLSAQIPPPTASTNTD